MGIARLAQTPPPSPKRARWSVFFGGQKQRFKCVVQTKCAKKAFQKPNTMIIEVFPPGIKGFVLSIQALIIQGVSLNYKLQTFRKQHILTRILLRQNESADIVNIFETRILPGMSNH